MQDDRRGLIEEYWNWVKEKPTRIFPSMARRERTANVPSFEELFKERVATE